MEQRDIWVNRSRVLRSQKYKGVLFRHFPELLNDYLHQWTVELITSHISGRDKNILDIGCGYGRLSIQIREKYPDALLVGLDISPYYLKEYICHVQNGSALLTDSAFLPFKKGSFDIVFEVFSLMYLPTKTSYRQATQEMLYALSDRGSMLVIENNRVGTFFLNGFGLFNLFSKFRSKKKSETAEGLIFSGHEIDLMIQKNGGVVTTKCGMPLFTLFIPLNILLSFVSLRLLRKILSVIRRLDPVFQFLNFFSLYHFYWIKKREADVYHSQTPDRSARNAPDAGTPVQ